MKRFVALAGLFVFIILVSPDTVPGTAAVNGFFWPVADRPPYMNLKDPSVSTAILLENVKFDLVSGLPSLPRDLVYPFQAGDKDAYYILHFNNRSWYRNKGILENTGVKFDQYVPHNGYICWIPASAYQYVKNQSFIDWCGLYQPVYKISAEIPGGTSQADWPEELEIQLFSVAAISSVKARLQNLGITRIIEDHVPGSPCFRVSMTKEQLVPVSFIEGVKWITEYVRPVLLNDSVPGIVQNNCPDNNAACRPLWYNHDLNGEHQLVGVVDSGLDHDNCGFADPVNPLLTREFGTYQDTLKVPRYHLCPGGATVYDGPGGHGTSVSSCAAGDATASDPTTYDNTFSGVAVEAQIWFLDIGYNDSLQFNYGAWYNEMLEMMDAGVASVNNSWGVADPAYFGKYLTSDKRCDEAMWYKNSAAVCNAAGNDGSDPETVGSPACAKNCISVGSCRDYNSMNAMSSFSSRGLTLDGRIKPDLVAPGSAGSSSSIRAAESDGDINSDNCDWVSGIQGTSFASPYAAGCVALIHQYFEEGFYPTGTANPPDSMDPSGTLLKAVMINSGALMTGSGVSDPKRPGKDQGWGRVLLEDALYFSGQSRKLLVVDNKTGLYDFSNDVLTEIVVFSASEPLKVTLVWSDYPGDTSRPTGVQLVNDLDLEVTVGATTYYGNNFHNDGWTDNGTTVDDLNNVECVYLETPAVGTYEIYVKVSNIPEPAQPFALVVSGDISLAPPTPTPTGTWYTRTPTPTITPSPTPTFTFTPTPIYAACATAFPDPDGVFTTGEWSDATITYIDETAGNPFPVYVYHKNDSDWLYICLDAVNNTDTTIANYAGVYFDSGNDNVFTSLAEDCIEVYKDLSVQHKYWVDTAYVLNAMGTSGVPFSSNARDELGMEAAVGYGATENSATSHYFYEFKIPFILGELNTAMGDTIAFYEYIHTGSLGTYFHPATVWDSPETFLHLVLDTGCVSPPTPTPTITPTAVYAGCALKTTIIDGVFSSGEWDDAGTIDVTSGSMVQFPMKAYFKNDPDWIYICLDAYGITSGLTGPHDGGVYFDTGHDHVLSTGQEDAGVQYRAGANYLMTYSGGGIYSDYDSSTSGVPYVLNGRDQAGTIIARGLGPSPSEALDHYIYEFKIPMALGDLNVSMGGVAGLYVICHANALVSAWPPDLTLINPSTWANLYLADACPSPTPTPTPTSTPTWTPTGTNTPTPTATPTADVMGPVYQLGSFVPDTCVSDLTPDCSIDVQDVFTGLDMSRAGHQYSRNAGLTWLPLNNEGEDSALSAPGVYCITCGFDESVTDPDAENGFARYAEITDTSGAFATGPFIPGGVQASRSYITALRMKVSDNTSPLQVCRVFVNTNAGTMIDVTFIGMDFEVSDEYRYYLFEWSTAASPSITFVETKVFFYSGRADLWLDVIRTFDVSQITGSDGSQDVETQSALGVPFNQYSLTDNLIHFCSQDLNGNFTLSTDNIVCIVTPTDTPTFTPTFTPTPTNTPTNTSTYTPTGTFTFSPTPTPTNTPTLTPTETPDMGSHIIYVDAANEGGTEDGTSWATAWGTIMEAVDDPFFYRGTNNTITIKEGEYTETVELISLHSGEPGRPNTIKSDDGNTQPVIVNAENTREYGVYISKSAQDIVIDGLVCINATSSCISLENSSDIDLINVVCENSLNTGLSISAGSNTSLRNALIDHNTFDGLVLKLGSEDTMLYNITTVYNGRRGIMVKDTSTGTGMYDCITAFNAETGVYFSSASLDSTTSINNNDFFNNGVNGLMNLFTGIAMLSTDTEINALPQADSNFVEYPDFKSGYYLRNQSTNPCVDSGSRTAVDAGLDTRYTGDLPDSGTVDLGYHYAGPPPVLVIPDNTRGSLILIITVLSIVLIVPRIKIN